MEAALIAPAPRGARNLKAANSQMRDEH